MPVIATVPAPRGAQPKRANDPEEFAFESAMELTSEYRTLLQIALDKTHNTKRENHQLRESLRHLRIELAALRKGDS